MPCTTLVTPSQTDRFKTALGLVQDTHNPHVLVLRVLLLSLLYLVLVLLFAFHVTVFVSRTLSTMYFSTILDNFYIIDALCFILLEYSLGKYTQHQDDQPPPHPPTPTSTAPFQIHFSKVVCACARARVCRCVCV